MIKAIIWDMGGVLNHREDESWQRKWEAQLNLLSGPLEEIVFSSHQATLGEITPEVDYIRCSLEGRYKLGVLSDAWLGTRDRVQEWVNYDLFDVIMFSAEEGVRKPDPKMYQRMLS
jgi:FMN phosphatase YigB (HAD superfamily)